MDFTDFFMTIFFNLNSIILLNNLFLLTFNFKNNIQDVRCTSRKLLTLSGHKEEIIKVQWSNFNMGVLASCSSDRRVIVWDLTKENDEI